MKKIGVFLLGVTISGSVLAGFNGLTHHSRANCGNNESISWDGTRDHMLNVTSGHDPQTGFDQDRHQVEDKMRSTWRSAAVHWGEGAGTKNWIVYGTHWMKDRKGKLFIADTTRAVDCSIYDGWWDR
jgi:hypothetical protein